ncbi:hypothetical protein BJY04DRAFT_217294 [Aspergillus karnatakaensis]|uniref:uncharacterized protein n=1 Tax=Aspergillus karnatakaensis TaxID=1810916 RepID=UPI003CCCD53B
MFPVKSATALSLLSILTQVHTQEILGCADLNCPLDGTYKCHLADATYSNVGLAEIPDVPAALNGLSLLKAVRVTNAEQVGGNSTNPDDVPYQSSYFLSIPEGINTDDVSGCAVIFNDSPGDFGGDDLQTATGTCPDIIEQSCIDALVQRASEGTGGNCDALDRSLRENAIEECANFSGDGNGLGNFSVASLSDLSTISGAQNGSSDCWPTREEDGLAVVREEVVFSEFTDAEALKQLFKVTPILTVFPGDGDSDASAQLTCLKVVEVIEDEGGEGGDDAGALFSANMLTMASGVVASVLFALL